MIWATKVSEFRYNAQLDSMRKDGREVECDGLEIRYTVFPYRGFESLSFRHSRIKRIQAQWWDLDFLFSTYDEKKHFSIKAFQPAAIQIQRFSLIIQWVTYQPKISFSSFRNSKSII